jgi:hypothetical protein
MPVHSVLHHDFALRIDAPPDRRILIAAIHGNTHDLSQALGQGGDPNGYVDVYGNSPLILASSLVPHPHNIFFISTLVAAGALIDHRDRQGSTAAMRAAAAGYTSSVALLTELGADLSLANDKGHNILTHASSHCRDLEFLSWLDGFVASWHDSRILRAMLSPGSKPAHHSRAL